ncbi:MAG: hypothetical protein LBC77_05505 [Spirochaetaceae bacterium]|jgi:hypothetical protein|nr:hypothetical protein [Spirochaetaceae bacterium]
MKTKLIIILFAACARLAAENFSVSFDPITFLALIPAGMSGTNQDGRPAEAIDWRNMWLCVELNSQLPNEKELGFGVFVRADRVALRSNYRSYYNTDRLSGFFWGFYGQLEWRKMYWHYDKGAELSVGWMFPVADGYNSYHSAGLTAGVDIGFRIRIGSLGITPYLGVGLPLFLLFGDKPGGDDYGKFIFINGVFRAVDIGLRLDFFQ